jgi:ornithine cyclodeaminase/alanine dehydrogenase-like protein (mu-crystallin family)
MPILILNEEEVRQLLTMDMALEAVEAGFRKLALDEAQNVPRARCQTDHSMLHVMSGAAKTLGIMGYKAYTTAKAGAQFHVGLFDGKTGALTAILQADYLGQVRTGAASGVATKYLARPEAAEVGLYGAGKQARQQLVAVCKVRKIKRVQVYSRNEENRKQFCTELTGLCGVPVEPVAKPEEAARGKDIVITAMSSRDPVLKGEWLAEGMHLNVIGSNFISKAEVDAEAIRRCRPIVVDSKDQAHLEAGDFHQAIESGAIHWSGVAELGPVIVGRASGRKSPQEISLFKSLGIAMEDITTAARVVAKAKEAGVGRYVEW